MKKIKVGIIGLGNIAQTIHLPILSKLPDAEIVAVCDPDKAKARFVAEKFNSPRVYTSYEQMLKQEEEIIGIDICAHTAVHKEISIASFEAGKHVLVEKPLARTYEEAVAIVKAAKAHDRKLMIGMNNRFRPDAMIMKSFVQGGELGKIFYTRAGWFRKLEATNPWRTQKQLSGGGVILDLGLVLFDLAFWMMGYPEVQEVMASMYSHSTKNVEDTAIVFMKMKNETTISIETSWSFERDQDFFYCDCYGTEGSGSLNPFRILKRMHGNLVNVAPATEESAVSLYRKSYRNELQHWINVLKDLTPIISTGEESIHRMKVVDALYKSARTGKAVKVI